MGDNMYQPVDVREKRWASSWARKLDEAQNEIARLESAPRAPTNVNEILEAMGTHSITLKNLIDAFIKNEGIVGVGLITLQEQLSSIVHAHYNSGGWKV